MAAWGTGMSETQFAERMALIRGRFAAKLAVRIKETDTALPRLAGDGREAIDAVAATYRRFHDMCGIAPTIGFDAVGRAARGLVDGVLVAPFRAERGLTTAELARLMEGLDAFRAAARAETQSIDQAGSM